MNERVLILSMGDPNGIGPELAARLFADRPPSGRFLIIGPEKALAGSSAAAPWTKIEQPELVAALPEGLYLWEPPALAAFQPRPGRAQVSGGRAAGLILEESLRLIKNGQAAGLVTLPINKAMFQEAGYHFGGHTEFLAETSGAGADNVYMHLAGDILRVSLVTTHPPLRAVADLITFERVLGCLRQTDAFIKQAFAGQAALPLAVCGLNPHAGEDGRIGSEEEIITRAVRQAVDEGIRAQGPLPADSLFYRAAQGRFAAVVAMYHDQGLGPLKMLHFHNAVNITLGLPFVRTSVDHGTAYELVGRGEADTGSLLKAIRLAQRLI